MRTSAAGRGFGGGGTHPPRAQLAPQAPRPAPRVPSGPPRTRRSARTSVPRTAAQPEPGDALRAKFWKNANKNRSHSGPILGLSRIACFSAIGLPEVLQERGSMGKACGWVGARSSGCAPLPVRLWPRPYLSQWFNDGRARPPPPVQTTHPPHGGRRRRRGARVQRNGVDRRGGKACVVKRSRPPKTTTCARRRGPLLVGRARVESVDDWPLASVRTRRNWGYVRAGNRPQRA